MEINLFELVNLLVRKLWIIILTAIVCASLAFAYSYYYLIPLYTSTTTLYINNSQVGYEDKITSSDISAAQDLVDTEVEIIKSQSVIKLVYEDIGRTYSLERIEEMVSAAPLNESVIIKISVQCENPEDAQKIADSFVKNSRIRIEKIIQKSGVEVVDEANLPKTQSYPNNKSYLILGFLAGIIISAVCLVVVDILDTRIDTEQAFAETFPDITIIGIIPKIDEV